MALLLLPSPLTGRQAAGGDEVILDWHGAGAEAFRLGVPSARLAAFLQQREAMRAEARNRLVSALDAAVEHEVAALFEPLIMRLPLYADWAYGWLDSYIAAYQIIGRVAEQAATDGLSGATLREIYEGLVTERFNEIVLAPALRPDAPQAAMDRLQAAFTAAAASLRAEDARALDRFLLREARVLAPLPPSGMVDGCMPGHPAGPARVTFAGIEPPDQTVLLTYRFVRPFGARGAILLARGGMLGGGGGGLLGLVLQPGFAGLATLMSTTALIWAGDYALSRLDVLLHRGAFEGALVARMGELRAAETNRLQAMLRNAAAALPDDLPCVTTP